MRKLAGAALMGLVLIAACVAVSHQSAPDARAGDAARRHDLLELLRDRLALLSVALVDLHGEVSPQQGLHQQPA